VIDDSGKPVSHPAVRDFFSHMEDGGYVQKRRAAN
jgi:heat shock protein HspQ